MAGTGTETATGFNDDPTELTHQLLSFGDGMVEITTAPFERPLDILPGIEHPEGFHGSPLVHHAVYFGDTLAHLRGTYTDPEGLFADRVNLPGKGIVILSDHVDEAGRVVEEINRLALRVIADPSLYDDPAFCDEYYGLTGQGYELLATHLPGFRLGKFQGVPVSLERAALVTTRLARGLDKDADVPGEVRVVTKRAHPKGANPAELMVTVKWRDPNQIATLKGATLDFADFVNPASGASTAAVWLALESMGVAPDAVIHRSIMATTQGIAFAHKVLLGRSITPIFYTLGVSGNLTEQYYLTNPAVADAGDALRLALPSWYRD